MFARGTPPPPPPGGFFYQKLYISRRKIEKGGILLYNLIKITIFQGENLKKGFFFKKNDESGRGISGEFDETPPPPPGGGKN